MSEAESAPDNLVPAAVDVELLLAAADAEVATLRPAIHSHINPYGRLTADLSRRIDFEQRVAA